MVPARHLTRDRSVRPPGYLRAFGRRLVIVSQYQSAAVSAHPREEPHWYLAFIGVDPVRQGYGVGAALLRSWLRRCDEKGLPEGAPVVSTMWRPGDLRDDAS